MNDESYYFIGGDNCSVIDKFSLEFQNARTHEIKTVFIENDMNEFLLLLPEDNLIAEDTHLHSLRENFARLYNSVGEDITKMMFIDNDNNDHGLSWKPAPSLNDLYTIIRAAILLYVCTIVVVYRVYRARLKQK
jgi:hypothetical protein